MTGYGLERCRDRIPVGAPVQTGPEAHSASCTMGTGSFQGVKRPGLDVDRLPQSSAEVKERVEVLLPLLALMACPTMEVSLFTLLYGEISI